MSDSSLTPRLAAIRLHPIKSLDPISVNEANIGPNGGLELDRVWALFSSDGKWINGKRAPAIHLIRATYKPDLSGVGLSAPEDHRGIEPIRVKFPTETEKAAKWFSDYFEQPVIVRYAREGFPDDGLAAGPTIVSTASLQAVCDWFAGITLNEARERFRATLEIEGVPSFWEDQLFGPDENYVVRFKVGNVTFEGSNPCARCPVPPRNPRTGEDWPGFAKLFSELRRATLPPWAPQARFDHFYRLSTNTRVPSTEQGKLLRLGDPVVLS
ncbi:MAG TPA: MOSC N-terminal beta barrel domain-containing protein [Candidatus Dormibacteraeota bacterium]|nr:MOSC N-terminal beta barrel domain-containing protein [Candidatus Dormibacteraeota bacterium]